MKQRLLRLKTALFREEPDFRLQFFNTLGIGGVAISFIMAAVTLATGGGVPTAALNALCGLLAVLLIWYTNKSGRDQRGYLITIVLVFLIVFPAMFFLGGGYRSAMPCFFIFSILFTVFMLEYKRAFVFAGIELVLYTGCCLFAYAYPDLIISLSSERALLLDMLAGFVVVSLILGATMLRLLRLYDRQRQELERARLGAEAANRAKTEFLANASHEMRTPLTVISVNVQTAMDMLRHTGGEAADPEAAELLEDAQEEVMRLGRMVGGMLTLASISEGTEKSRTDLSALLGGAADMLRLLLRKRGNELRAEVEDGLTVFGSADLLSQVVVNLIQNAHAHTGHGVICLRAAREEAGITVTVSDNGSGISPDLLPRVFERGVTEGGTGFGLFLCKTVVDSHGGSIHIESEVGRGTVVSFTLPAYQGQYGGDGL